MTVFFPLRYAVAYGLGGLLARLRYTRTRRIDCEGEVVYEKYRPAWFAPLLAAGNVYLRISGAGTRVLVTRAWRQREFDMYRLLHDRDVSAGAAGTVKLPKVPGRPLGELLDDGQATQAEKWNGIQAAAAALNELHRRLAETQSEMQPRSHGDATVHNVLIDADLINTEAGIAHWIDFDMAHLGGLPLEWCRADDFRALIYSAATNFKVDDYALLADTVVDSIDQPETLRNLRAAVEYWQQRPAAFHLAQAQLTRSQRTRLDEVLLQKLPAS